MSGIRLSPKHGLNPAIPKCYYCLKDKNEVLLFGLLKGDAEAPRGAVINKEPCEQCKEYMKMGIVLISVRDDGRDCACLQCKHKWFEPLTMSEHTPNLSGEATIFCPQCSSKSVSAGPVQKQDRNDPDRTGGWVVIKEEFISRAVEGDSLENILEKRFAFVEDRVWDGWGLPRGSEAVETETKNE